MPILKARHPITNSPLSTCLTWMLFATSTVVRLDAFRPPLQDRRRAVQQAHFPLEAIKTASSKRSKKLSNLVDWASENNIQIGGVEISSSPGSDAAGLGIFAKQDLAPGSLVLTVPSDVALSVESPGSGPDDSAILSLMDRRALADLPWFVQFSVYLFSLDKLNSMKNDRIDMRPWLDSLPRSFDTPIHWTAAEREEMQYAFLLDSVARQQSQWDKWYKTVTGGNANLKGMSWEDFLWGCECARSRAFSGAYTGSAFNPFSYAFTLLLVLVYVGFNLGTLEQAANGAGLVFCAQVLKDFVLPKLFKKKRFVIGPVLDMANHNSIATAGEVSFEFFGDAYSLAILNGASVPNGNELFISYGARSNDQLLQYYGFVEPNNPHDVYIMPPLRDWDIGALEKACGRTFAAGRLGKLDRAGLLGGASNVPDNVAMASDDSEGAANIAGGVVVTRATGVDPAVIQALRALVSNESEWKTAGGAIGNFVEEFSAGEENERLARLAAKTAIELELAAKSTTLEADEELLKKMETIKSMDSSTAEKMALVFRIEKKKLLTETLQKLQ